MKKTLKKEGSAQGAHTRKRVIKREIKKITKGLFSAVTDLVLFTLYLPFLSVGKPPTSKGVHQTFDEAHQLLAGLNFNTLQRAFYHLQNKGLIKRFEDWQITKAGKNKLKNLLPVYDEKRVWNGKLYLVNYDIEREKNHLRDIFRKQLLRIGSIKLQNSLYLCCYKPTEILKEIIEKYQLQNKVLISELTKEGFLEEDNIKEFIWNHADLEIVNQQYWEFLEKYKHLKNEASRTKIAIQYYAILRNDPQIPFELLKDEYLGDRAYLLFLRLSSSTNAG